MADNCRLLNVSPDKQKILDWVEEAKVGKSKRLASEDIFQRSLEIETTKPPKINSHKSIEKPLWARVGLRGKSMKSRTNQWGSRFWGRKKRSVNGFLNEKSFGKRSEMTAKLTNLINSTSSIYSSFQKISVDTMTWLNSDIKPRLQKIKGMKATKQMIMFVVMPGLQSVMTSMPVMVMDEKSFEDWEEKFECEIGEKNDIEWMVEVKC